MTNEHIARVCHEVNRAYCEALGDTSQPAWEDAPEWQRKSAMKGVELHLRNNVFVPSPSMGEGQGEGEAFRPLPLAPSHKGREDDSQALTVWH